MFILAMVSSRLEAAMLIQVRKICTRVLPVEAQRHAGRELLIPKTPAYGRAILTGSAVPASRLCCRIEVSWKEGLSGSVSLSVSESAFAAGIFDTDTDPDGCGGSPRFAGQAKASLPGVVNSVCPVAGPERIRVV
jgi:hypothetical protein